MANTHNMNNKDILTLMDSFPGGMIKTDITGKILAVNTTLEKVFNTPREKLIGTSGFSYLEKAVGKDRGNVLENVVKNKKPAYFIDYERGHWWKTVIIPDLDSSGKVIGFCAYFNEITTEMEKEKGKLIDQEQYYISLIENSSDLITIIDKTGKILYISPPLKQLLGYDPSERIGKHVFENVHQNDRTQLQKIFKTTLHKKGLTEKRTYRLKDTNGIYHHFETIANNQLDNPIIEGIILNSRDITDSVKDKEEILKQKNFLNKIVNGTCEIIFAVDRDGKIILWNTSAERNTSLPRSKVLWKKIHHLDLFENHAEIEKYLTHAFRGEETGLDELIINSTIGGRRLWSVSSSQVKSDDKTSFIVFICSDITFKDEVHLRLLPGTSYMISDVTSDALFNAFNDLKKQKWTGLCISRKISEVEQVCSTDVQPKILLFGDNDSNEKELSGLDEVYSAINTFLKENKNVVICLDRIDYLISRYGFENVLSMLYRLNDLVSLKKAILLVRINKTLFSSEQIAYLNEEFSIMPSKQLNNIFLGADENKLLTFIQIENKKNRMINQKDICNHLNISKVTAQKRIEELEEKGLVTSKLRGRSKYIYLTDKGKEILHRRQVL